MKILLLKDISDPYYGSYYKAGDIVLVKLGYGCTRNSTWQVIEVQGHGVYLYAKEGEWEIVD